MQKTEAIGLKQRNIKMNAEQKRMLINLIVITDEYDLLQEKDQSDKDYKDIKKKAYHSLTRFIMRKGI